MVRQSKTGQGVAAHLLIRGRVQGVGYRFFAQDLAGTLGLCGWVRNLPDQTVECYAEGPRPAVEAFIEDLKKGPSLARIDDVEVDWLPSENQYDTFVIR